VLLFPSAFAGNVGSFTASHRLANGTAVKTSCVPPVGGSAFAQFFLQAAYEFSAADDFVSGCGRIVCGGDSTR
jgi:hypothetical protein